MLLKIQEIDREILKESEKYFGDFFCGNLKKEKVGTYSESLVARYLIEKNKNIFSSISHKKDLVFIGTNKTRIAVDIEIFKIRDNNLLDKFREEEYSILGGKNWNNFYILWTAKESIIKYLNLKLDDIEKIVIIKKIEKKGILSGLEFIKEMNFKYNGKNYIVYSSIKGEKIFSFCIG